jgi:hypothetical protein
MGDMQRLVELTEVNSDLKNKLRHLLRLSLEKWEEVASHALQAVVPDFRCAAACALQPAACLRLRPVCCLRPAACGLRPAERHAAVCCLRPAPH